MIQWCSSYVWTRQRWLHRMIYVGFHPQWCWWTWDFLQYTLLHNQFIHCRWFVSRTSSSKTNRTFLNSSWHSKRCTFMCLVVSKCWTTNTSAVSRISDFGFCEGFSQLLIEKLRQLEWAPWLGVFIEERFVIGIDKKDERCFGSLFPDISFCQAERNERSPVWQQ